MASRVVTVNDILDGHVGLDLECFDRIYLDVPYSMSQMSYDLRRLRLKGLITRLPHTNTYVLTEEGQRVATFYTKLHNRLLQPLLAAHDPPAPLALRQALQVINHHVDDYISEARMTA